jgi:hypothetical protein
MQGKGQVVCLQTFGTRQKKTAGWSASGGVEIIGACD